MARRRRDPTPLEVSIMQARDGVLSEDLLLLIFGGGTVIVPSSREPLNSATEVRPALIPSATGMRVAVFTHADLVGGIPKGSRYQVEMDVAVLLDLIPADTGITVNPRSMTMSFDMTPGAVQALRHLSAGAPIDIL